MAQYPRRARRQLRIAFVIMIIAALAFLPQDQQIDPENGIWATGIRLFAALPLALMGLALTFIRRLDRFAQLYVAVLYLGQALCTVGVLTILDDGGQTGHGLSSATGLSNISLLIIFAYAVSTLRFVYATLISALIGLSYFGFAAAFANIPLAYFISADFSNIILVLLVGGFIGITREIYLRRDFQAQLRLEERFRHLVEGSIQGIFVHRDFQPLFANQAIANIFGVESSAKVLRRTSCLEFFAPEEHERIAEHDRALLAGEPVASQIQCRGLTASGQRIWLDCLTRSVRWGEGDAVQYTVIDVTERKLAEDERRQLSQAVEQNPAEILIFERDGEVRYANRQFMSTNGRVSETVIGHSIRELKLSRMDDDHFQELWQVIHEGEVWEGEVQSLGRDGEARWEHVAISPIRDETDTISHFTLTAQDISIRKIYEDRLLHRAHYDQLTELPNRILAYDRLVTALHRAERDRSMVGVMFIDLDHFKKVNDLLGHNAGDELIRQAAARLGKCARKHDTIARLGGDEFAAVLPDLRRVADAEMLAQRITKAFAEPFMIQQNEIFATASIGITIFPLDGMDPVFLMRNADAAMYEAKKSGRNGYHFFTNALNEEIQNRGRLEKQLRRAVESNEFALHYQPQVDPYTGSIEGAEALLRWTTNDGDTISPGRFIPVAEDTGLIVPLGHWVLKEAISWINQWRQQGRGPRFVAVNVSPRQFREAGFVEGVLGLLSETNTPPDALEIEVTESLLIEDDSHENVAQVFDHLKAAGVRLSIDDFGTGYSSLSYLKKFPFDTLKIDASFIRQIADSKDDQALVEAISGMARSLGLKVVAEGVEDREQLEILMNMSCDYIQGYYFGHAMPAHSFAELINDAEPRQNIVSLTDR